MPIVNIAFTIWKTGRSLKLLSLAASKRCIILENALMTFYKNVGLIFCAKQYCNAICICSCSW